MSEIMGVLNEPIGIWIAAILTIMVYSYLLGDNPLFRIAEHLLVGSAIAYAVVIAIHSVLIPRLFVRLANGQWLYLIPLLLGILLLAKIRPPWADLGNVSMGLVIGVGAALAISGAVTGTIGPQVQDTVASLNPAEHPASGWLGVLNTAIIAVGTIGTLLYFQFSARRSSEGEEKGRGRLVEFGASVGRLAIMISFGAIFASLVMSRVSLFIGRVQFLLGDWLHLISMP